MENPKHIVEDSEEEEEVTLKAVKCAPKQLSTTTIKTKKTIIV